MKLRLAALVLSAVCAISSAYADDSSREETARMVSEAIARRGVFKAESLANYRELMKALQAQFCPGYRYRHYRAGDSVYVIGKSGDNIVIGRNFKYRVTDSSADVASIQASTKGCLEFDVPKNVVALTMTHSVSPEPTEFHLIANLVYGVDLYVSAESGLWKISGGRVELMRDDKSH